MKAENLVVKFIFLLILASLTACTENPLEVKQEAPTENIEDGSVLQKKPSGSTTVFFTGSNEEYLIWVYLEINRFYEKDRALMISGSMGYQIDHKKEDTKALVSDLPFENIPLKIQGDCNKLTLHFDSMYRKFYTSPGYNNFYRVFKLDEAAFNITHDLSSKELLGNLVCTVQKTYNNPGKGSLNGTANLLNRILALLGDVYLYPM